MAVYSTNTMELTSIADAIREKCNINLPLTFPTDYISVIDNIQILENPQSKTITPTENVQTITYDLNYDGLSTVTVNPISSNYIGTNVSQKNSSHINTNGNIFTVSPGYYSNIYSKNVESGSVFISSSSVNVNFNIVVNSTTGVINTNIISSYYVSANLVSGYTSLGDSGTISIYGNNISQLSVLSGYTVSLSENEVVAIEKGKFLLSDIKAAAINSMYIGAGVSTLSSNLYYPGSVNLTISSDCYLLGDQTIKGDANLISANIKKNVHIFSITGTFENTENTIFEDELITRRLSGIYINQRITSIRSAGFYGAKISGIEAENCTTVSSYAFKNCSNLTYISFYSCTNVGSSAFENCIKLSNIYLPNCQSISSMAFAGCLQLHSIELPACISLVNSVFYNTPLEFISLSTISQIASNTFKEMSTLQSVYAPSVTSIGSAAFQSCTGLLEVNFPNCKSIYISAFEDCYSLTNINLPLCENIESHALRACSNLSYVYLPSCTSMSGYVFYDCSNLISADLPLMSSIAFSTFAFCRNLKSISCPNASIIGAQAFYMTGFESVYLPSITSIGNLAFGNCYSLVSVEFPNCTTISSYAFRDCSALKHVSFANITSIPQFSVFQSCYNIETLYLPKMTTMSIGSYFTLFSISSTLKYINFDAVTYQNVLLSHWQNLERVEMRSLSSVRDFGFYNCNNLSYIDISACTRVNYYAFGGCSNLTFINLPACESIGTCAFDPCINLISISAPNVSIIGEGAFIGCTSLSYVDFPLCSSVRADAFRDCTNISYASLPLLSILGSSAFKDCINLSSVYLPSCKTIYSDAFLGCSKLSYINLPACESIISYALRSTSFVFVNLPACTFIDAYAFTNCSNLEEISIPFCQTINRECFEYCSALKSISLPSCQTIGPYAFAFCSNLSTVYLDVCTSIPDACFVNCDNIFSIYLLGSSMTQLNRTAFVNTPLEANYYGTAPQDSTFSGAIYVPMSLLTDYQTDTRWCYLSSIFVGI